MRIQGITIGMLAILAVGIAATMYAYPLLPAEIATHWNAAGEADGYTAKNLGVLFIPLVMLAIVGLWLGIPYIDPLKKNLEEFRSTYDAFFLALMLFSLYLFGLMLTFNLGYEFHFGQFLVPGLAFLFGAAGILLRRAKRNWFIGIRTPWTLSNDTVWEKTHRLGAYLFGASAVVMLAGIFFPEYLLWFVFVPLVGTAVATIVYSYIEFKREVR